MSRLAPLPTALLLTPARATLRAALLRTPARATLRAALPRTPARAMLLAALLLTPARAMLLAALLLTPARGRAEAGISANGHLAGSFLQTDTSSTGQPEESTPFWGWDAGFGLQGGPFDPGVLRWSADASYRDERTLYDEGTDRSDELGYQLSLDLLGDSPAPTALSAARGTSTFATEKGATLTGRTELATEAFSTGLALEGVPNLRLGLVHLTTHNESPAAPSSDTEAATLSASASASPGDHAWSLSYDTSWSEGTYVETNYRAHLFQLQAFVRPDADLEARLTDRYSLRLPTKDGPTNPRIDENDLGAGVSLRLTPAARGSIDYAFRHVLVALEGDPQAEEQSHSLVGRTDVELDEAWLVYGSLGFGHSLRRAGAEVGTVVGENVGAGARWHRAFDREELTLGSGGFLGHQQLDPGDDALIFGGDLSVGGATNREAGRGTLNYTTTWASGGLVTVGTTWAHQLNLGWDTQLSGEVDLRSLLSARLQDRDDPLFGRFLDRSVLGSVDAGWTFLSGQASAGWSDGLSEPLGGADAGALLPVDLRTETRFAALTGTAWFDRRTLSVTGLLRTSATEAPGRPQQFEHAAGATVAYQIGQFTASVEERWSMGGYGDALRHGNLVMVRLQRSFGATF